METRSSTVAEQAASKAGEAVEKTKQQLEGAKGEAQRGLRRAEDYIREHPTESALGALGLGFLLARLLPVRFVAVGLGGLMVAILKPLALLYAALRIVDDFRASDRPILKGISTK